MNSDFKCAQLRAAVLRLLLERRSELSAVLGEILDVSLCDGEIRVMTDAADFAISFRSTP